MADAIRERTGIDATLVKGHGGVFEVSLDGESVFSKKALGRFPDPGEVEGELTSRLATV